jgi:hypothetical protein
MTWNGRLPRRTVLPIGSMLPKSISAVVWPIRQTLAARVTSWWVKEAPRSTTQRRICRYSGETPRYEEYQFWLP